MKQDPSRRTFIGALVASLALHLALVLLIPLLGSQAPSQVKELVEIDFISLPPLEQSEERLKQETVETREQQIVEQSEQAVNDEVPKDTRYLSRHNQVVQEETVAFHRGDFQNTGEQRRPGEESSQQTAQTETETTGDESGGSNLSLANLRAFDWQATAQRGYQRQNDTSAFQGEGGETEVSQSPDYLRDVNRGIQTLLSTREFIYYSYYSRIRRQLSQQWEPLIKQKIMQMYHQGRGIASSQDRITRLVIVLDQEGTLINIQVLSESGIRDLDEAAIEAFRAAAPFPNPPSGIVDEDGTIKIRWDFVLEA